MKKYLSLLFIALFGLIAVVDLLHPGFPVTHDGQDHIARIANFYQSLSEGILVPRWAANLNYGYGHPILEFLYPFPSYVASFFKFLGFSFIDSTKLVFALAMVASGFAMYAFTKKLWGNAAGVVSGILYMYAPYRFVDLYVRGDIGEHVAFVFVPLSFLGLYLLSQKQTFSRLLFASVAIALLIVSHNAIALMVMPLILLYAVFLVWNHNFEKRVALPIALGIVFGFLLSGFFWFPALVEGQYTLRNIVTKGEYATRFVSFAQLLYGKWDYGIAGQFTVQIGILHWLSLVSGLFFAVFLWSKYRKQAILLGGLVVCTIVAIFLMLPMSSFIWQRVILLQNFQFPWRFLAIPVFTTSLLGGFTISQLSSRNRKIGVVLVSLVLLFFSKDYIHARIYEQKPESFFTGIYSKTTDTGESSPIWSVRFMLSGYDKPLQLIDGSAQITQEKRTTTMHSYVVSSKGKSLLLENTVYFPGWRVLIDGQPVTVQFQNPVYRGLMTFSVENGTHTVVVSYQESKLRFAGDILTLLGIASLVYIFLFIRFKKKS